MEYELNNWEKNGIRRIYINGITDWDSKLWIQSGNYGNGHEDEPEVMMKANDRRYGNRDMQTSQWDEVGKAVREWIEDQGFVTFEDVWNRDRHTESTAGAFDDDGCYTPAEF